MSAEKKQQPAMCFADQAFMYRMLWGGAVIPVNPLTKKPLVKWRHIKAENPPEEIDEWAKQFPNAMLGVLCGERSAERYFVVDRDRHVDKEGNVKDGFASFAALEKKYGLPAPETMGTRTPGNGAHSYFKLPPGVKIKNSASQFAPGVDIRSTGGFVVAAGSMRADRKTYDHVGPYGIADAPSWVLFHALFRSRQRERLAARGILCAADFGDLPVEQWTAKARELLRPPRKDGGSRPVCETARKEVLLKYAMTAFEREYEAIQGLPQGYRDTELYASMTRCVSLLRGLEEEGFEVSGLEVDVFNSVTDAAAGLGDDYQCWDEENCQRKWDSLIDAADAGDIEARDLSNVGLDAKEKPNAEDEFPDLGGPDTAKADTGKPYVSTCMADVEEKPVKWLWEKRIPRGKITLVGGYPKLGKSQLCCVIAAPITKPGGKFPDGTEAPFGSVAFITGEDDADTIKPRLIAAGAEPAKVHKYELTRVKGADGKLHLEPFDVARHMPQLTAFIKDIPDLVAIFVDPILAYMGKTDSHKTAEVRGALLGLQTLAAERGLAVVLITHLNKNEKGQNAMNRFASSGAFAAVARSVWLAAHDPADPTKKRRLWIPIGGNNAAHDDGFAYSIESATTPAGTATSRAVFEPNTVTIDADKLLGPTGPRDLALQEAKEFLLHAFAGKPLTIKELVKAAGEDGINAKTLRRAAGELKAKRVRIDGKACWDLEQLDGKANIEELFSEASGQD
jgi:putative DNA primase/helicase